MLVRFGAPLPRRAYRSSRAIVFITLSLTPAIASAEDLHVHVGAGGAHAVGGAQSSEFGFGGGGRAALELALAKVVGVQAGASALVLSKGNPPADPTLAPSGTGSVMLGTVGVRFHPLGASRVAGPWLDVNGGFARTGESVRPAFDAHVGWEFRIAREARWDAGPFIGYTHVTQPNDALRPDDARILWAGITVSFGAREIPVASPPPAVEPPPEPELAERDGDVEVVDVCSVDGELPSDDGCASAGKMRIVQDRIHLDDLVEFEFGSARVRSRSHPLLRRLAKFINEHSEITEVSIEGHTDAVGTEDFNKELSEARAESTRKMLLKFGAEPSRIVVVAHGKSQPRVNSLGREAKNRRVEFYVKRKNVVQTTSAETRGQW